MKHLQKANAHIRYDTKYEMIHNFFVSRLKKHSTRFGWIFLVITALALGAYIIFKQNPRPLLFVWVTLDNQMGNQ